MRIHLLESFLLIWLAASGDAILPHSQSKETSFGKNNLADILSPKTSPSERLVTEATTTYECLYVSPDLPVCDFGRMEDSEEEDITHSTADYYPETKASVENFGNGQRARIRRNILTGMKARPVESHGRNMIVYTIEGCLPPRLPFEMPACQQKSSLDKILEVRKLYPFTVKRLTRPPLVFPEFNFDRWTRMIKRVRNHNSNNKKNQKVISKNELADAKEAGQSRASPLTDVVPIKATMPNRTMANTKVSKVSLAKGFNPHKQNKSAKMTKTEQRKIKLNNSLQLPEDKKLGTKKKPFTEYSFTPRKTEKTNEDDLQQSIAEYEKSDLLGRKTKSDFDMRRKKVERRNSSWGFRTLQKSWGSDEDDDRLPISKRLTWSSIPELPISKSRNRKLESTIGMKQNIYRNSRNFDGLSNDLSTDSNPDALLKLLHSSIATEYNQLANSRQTAVDVNELLTSSSRNLRKRREVRLPNEIPSQIFPSDFKGHEIAEKSTSHRRRVPRETGKSKGNDLDTLDKSSTFSEFKSSRLQLHDHEAANENQGTLERKSSKTSVLDAEKYSVMPPNFRAPDKKKDTRNKSTIFYKSKDHLGVEYERKASKKYFALRKSIHDYERRF